MIEGRSDLPRAASSKETGAGAPFRESRSSEIRAVHPLGELIGRLYKHARASRYARRWQGDTHVAAGAAASGCGTRMTRFIVITSAPIRCDARYTAITRSRRNSRGKCNATRARKSTSRRFYSGLPPVTKSPDSFRWKSSNESRGIIREAVGETLPSGKKKYVCVEAFLHWKFN